MEGLLLLMVFFVFCISAVTSGTSVFLLRLNFFSENFGQDVLDCFFSVICLEFNFLNIFIFIFCF